MKLIKDENFDVEEEKYWYTATDGRKVCVIGNETPLEAYNRMYPEDTRPKDDSGTPIDEEFDSDDSELMKEVQEELSKMPQLSEEQKRVRETERKQKNFMYDIIDNPEKYFTKKQLEDIKYYAYMCDIDYDKFLEKTAFKVSWGLSPKKAIKLVKIENY